MSEQIVGISYKADGTRVYTSSFKQMVLGECASGATAAELARKYQIPMQNIIKWKKQTKKIQDPKVEESVSSRDYGEAVNEIKRLQVEVKRLSKSLSNMTVDRDILKDAVDYASKKKWILPGT